MRAGGTFVIGAEPSYLCARNALYGRDPSRTASHMWNNGLAGSWPFRLQAVAIGVWRGSDTSAPPSLRRRRSNPSGFSAWLALRRDDSCLAEGRYSITLSSTA
jgi:hypothetical protein